MTGASGGEVPPTATRGVETAPRPVRRRLAGFGTGFVGIKTGLADVLPLPVATHRYDVGATVLLANVALRRGRWLPPSRGDLAAIAAAGVFLPAPNAVLPFVGQQYVTAGTAAAVFGIVSVLAPLFAPVPCPTRGSTPSDWSTSSSAC